jgi:hypothetical protein
MLISTLFATITIEMHHADFLVAVGENAQKAFGDTENLLHLN